MRYLYIALGIIATALGVIGIFIPLLPTTPFLLLAAALFFRSSERIYSWLINQKLLGSYIRNFREKRAIPLHAKIIAITMLWATTGYGIILTNNILLQSLLALILFGVTAYLLSFKTLRQSRQNQNG